MATADDAELVEEFERLFRDYYDDDIKDLARAYPTERRSLYLDWNDLYRYDPDLAEDYRSQPAQLREYAEEALRLYDLPIDVKLGQAHVRIRDLPESTDIRAIRSRHVNTLVQVSGIVRKATDVQPKVEQAAFECQRCGTLTHIPQSSGTFQEPHECQGCERQGPFQLNFDQSEFVDAQKLRVQESPEGLRGGETPQAIDVHIEDDVTGEVTPGDHVSVVGVLRLEQQGNQQEKSPLFDVYMEGITVEIDEEEFEDMEITDADKQEIVELSTQPDIYERMVASIAPSIYGYDQEKLAMTLQLFSGVTKHLPDESRIRGDLHMLLIGDPGTGKCQKYDTKITLGDGREVEIGELVERHLDDPIPVDDGVYQPIDIKVQSVDRDGRVRQKSATKVWKREAPPTMYRIRTASGSELEVTPSHPFFVQSGSDWVPRRSDELSEGEFIATPNHLVSANDDTLDAEFRRVTTANANKIDLPSEWTPELARLLGYIIGEGHVSNRRSSKNVTVTNADSEVIEDVVTCLEQLGLRYSRRSHHTRENVEIVVCSSTELVELLESIEPAIIEGSAQQCVPDQLFRTSDRVKTNFLRAYIEGEGHVSAKEREITVASMSQELLCGTRSLLLALGIGSTIEQRQNGSYRLRISGNSFTTYLDEVGFVTERKSDSAGAFREVETNTNTDIVPSIGGELRRIREALELTQFDLGIPRTTYQHYERGDRNPSRCSLKTVISAFEERIGELATLRSRIASGEWAAIEEARAELGVSQAELADGMDVEQTTVSYYERCDVVPDGGRIDGARGVLLSRIESALGVKNDVEALKQLVEADISWDRIETVEPVDPDYDWVYDLEVEDTHTYLSNGVVSHNSQLLSYVNNIAPRSVYTSGKGSSSAGLCVTGDTLIRTDDGFREIRDVVRPELPDPVDAETATEKEVGVTTFDRDAGEMTDVATSHAWRMPEKPCRRLETSHGKELEASVNTPVLTCGESGMEWTPISKIEPGAYVAVPRHDPSERSAVPVREFLELTTEKVDLAEESVALLRTELVDEFGTLRDAASELGLSEDFVYDTLSNRHVPQEKLDSVLDAVDACRADLRYDRLMIRHGDSVTVPDTFDEDLLYLLGLVFGDGDISLDRRDGNRGMVRISNGDEELLERAAAIFEAKFGERPEIERQEDRVPCIRINSATVARLFSNAGMESPKQDLALAPRLTTARHADAFLRGLMDADGSVSERSDGGSSVLLSTISETLARQVQLMLESYGVRARTRERDRRGTYELADGQTIESRHVQHFVELYGTDIERYADAIGFGVKAKQNALERIVGDAVRRGDRVPVAAALATVDGTAGQYYQNLRRGDNPGRGRARSMLGDLDLGETEPLVREAVEADLRWDEVVAVEDTGEKEVFDLTVPDTHNFVGNGIVTHNTAAAVRDDFGDGQQWTLEAGALVLADRGVAAVDELDKMRCVTGDSLVHFGDGRVDRIRDVAVEAAREGTVEELPNGRTIRDVDRDVWTMTDDGSVVTRPVTAIHEYDAPETLTEVELATGESLTSTDDHPFFVLEDGRRTERAAEELDPGDWVYVPSRIPDRVTDGGAASAAPTDNRPEGRREAMAAVLGYLAGDGNLYYDQDEGVYGIRFINAEEQLLSHFETACRRAFDGEPTRPPSEQRADGVETVRLCGREYADAVVDAGMNLETYDSKRLPRAVTTASREAKAAFLRALADSEGSVEERNVKVHSSSYELLLGAKHLLLEFGVSCQIQHRERDSGRDLYILVITDADSLRAFERHVGFTLDRKQRALDDVCDTVDGDRTILDVVPDCGELLADLRANLRLHQSECGIEAETYCNFENGDANVSIHRGRRILTAFEERIDRAVDDREQLAVDHELDWSKLAALKDRYHVTQSELADGTDHTQPAISRLWGEDDGLRETVRERLTDIVGDVADTELSRFRRLVEGDVKWRQVSAVRNVEATASDDQRTVLRQELASIVGCPASEAVERARALVDRTLRTDDWASLQREIDRYGVSHTDLAADLGVNQSTVSRWFAGTVETDRFDDVHEAARDRIADLRTRLEALLAAHEARAEPKVYDLTVEGTHNFVANGMVVHNSEDRSAMHQALEQQEISISKAGINATLKSRCSLLGAANPKYGRFDQYEPIGEQIDLEPALISRFDLIFTVTDEPDEEEDRNLAEHILTTNYAGELSTQRDEMASPDVTREEVQTAVEDVDPEIDAQLLRKYIAYAKQNCHPRMTDAAREAIRDFYVDLRAEGLEEDAPVPVTARQLEALVRLAEASARVRLSDTVSEDDAERVIEIVRSCLRDIGVDPETGQFDADVVETGTSKSQRDRIRNLKELIGDVEDEYEEGAPVDVVMERADEIGMDASKAEHEIENLKQKGEVYEPATGHLRTT